MLSGLICNYFLAYRTHRVEDKKVYKLHLFNLLEKQGGVVTEAILLIYCS